MGRRLFIFVYPFLAGRLEKKIRANSCFPSRAWCFDRDLQNQKQKGFPLVKAAVCPRHVVGVARRHFLLLSNGIRREPSETKQKNKGLTLLGAQLFRSVLGTNYLKV